MRRSASAPAHLCSFDAPSAWTSLQRLYALQEQAVDVTPSQLVDQVTKWRAQRPRQGQQLALPSVRVVSEASSRHIHGERLLRDSRMFLQTNACIKHVTIAPLAVGSSAEQLVWQLAVMSALAPSRSLTICLRGIVHCSSFVESVQQPGRLRRLVLQASGTAQVQAVAEVLCALMPRMCSLQSLSLVADDSNVAPVLRGGSAVPWDLVLSRLAGTPAVARVVQQLQSIEVTGTTSLVDTWSWLSIKLLSLVSTRLLHLSVTRCRVLPTQATPFATLRHCRQLRALTLSQVIETSTSASELTAALAQMHHLEYLDLSGTAPAARLACRLSGRLARCLRQLRVLRLSRCGIAGAEDLKNLSSALDQWSRLRVLNLSSNALSPDTSAMAPLVSALIKCACSLTSLDMSGSDTQFSQETSESLVRALWSASNLDTLAVPWHPARMSFVAQDLIPRLLHIKRIDLGTGTLDAQACAALAARLPAMRNISLVNLVGRRSSYIVGLVTGLAMSVHDALTSLALALDPESRCRSDGDAIVAVLAPALWQNALPQLKLLSLHGHAFTLRGLNPLVEALQQRGLPFSLLSLTHTRDAIVWPRAAAHCDYRILGTNWATLPTPRSSQAFGIVPGSQPVPPPRVPSLLELAASCMLSTGMALHNIQPVPRDLDVAELRKRLLPCVLCKRFTAHPRAVVAQKVVQGLLEAAMCSRCYHHRWLLMPGVDHSESWYQP